MESHEISVLLDLYFDGETSLAQEQQLRDYFNSGHVAPELAMYQSLFAYLQKESTIVPPAKLTVVRRSSPWLSIAASVAVLVSIGSFAYLNFRQPAPQELGTYENPEQALQATKKALALLSSHVNTGVESMQYLKTYENTKQKIFND